MTFIVNAEDILLKIQLDYEKSKLQQLLWKAYDIKIFPTFKFRIEELMYV